MIILLFSQDKRLMKKHVTEFDSKEIILLILISRVQIYTRNKVDLNNNKEVDFHVM